MRFAHALLAAAALLLGATSAQALIIDDFSVDQTSFIPPGAPAAVSFFGAVPAGVGNSREVTLNRTAGFGTVEFGADGGIGNIGFAPNSSGTATLNWDGLTDGNNGASGLGADLTDGGASSALRIVFRSDITGPLTVLISSGIGNYSTALVATPGLGLGAGFTTVLIPFASFVPSGSGANFANVGGIQLSIGSNFIGHDVQIDVIDTTAIPEPTTALLLGLGLAVGAGVVRRRAS